MDSITKKQTGDVIPKLPPITSSMLLGEKKDLEAMAKQYARAITKEKINPMLAFGIISRAEFFFKTIKDLLKPIAEAEAEKYTTIETKGNQNITKFPQQVFGELKISAHSINKQYDKKAIAKYISENADDEYKKTGNELAQLISQKDEIDKQIKSKKEFLKAQENNIIANAPVEIRNPIGEKITLSVK